MNSSHPYLLQFTNAFVRLSALLTWGIFTALLPMVQRFGPDALMRFEMHRLAALHLYDRGILKIDCPLP